MKDFAGKVAVVTGAGSGFGREFARIGAQLGMKLSLADIQPEALAATVDELRGQGAQVIGETVDVSRGADVERLAQRTLDAYGAVHLLFNNAGVASGGLVWENSVKDWEWVLGVNLWGVIHGVRTTEAGRYTWKYDPALSHRPRPVSTSMDLWSLVGGIPTPTLLQYGSHSRVVSDELADRMAKTMPRCSVERIERAGHALFTDQPDAFAASVERFVFGRTAS